MKIVSKFLFLVFLVLTACSLEKKSGVYTFSGTTMGTTFSIKAINDQVYSEDVYNTIQSEVDSILKEVNRQMSTYIPTSEISQFNKTQSTEWIDISSDFATVVKSALEICYESEGFFDITVGPLVNLWGFGPENRPTLVPSEKEIITRIEEIGFEKIFVKLDPPSIKKEDGLMEIDLSAIAKGFGVDKVAEYLENSNFKNFMVEIGGEIRTKGLNEKKSEWRIGISTPDAKMGIQKIINISGKTMATSGDYYNYFEHEGIRFSHTINPKTGKPITHKLASVTVINESCTNADGIATAINVMGPELGLKFADKLKLPIFMLVREGDGFKEVMNERFKKLLLNEKESK